MQKEEETQALRSTLLASGWSNSAARGLRERDLVQTADALLLPFSPFQGQRTGKNVHWRKAKNTPGARRTRKKRRYSQLGRGEG